MGVIDVVVLVGFFACVFGFWIEGLFLLALGAAMYWWVNQ